MLAVILIMLKLGRRAETHWLVQPPRDVLECRPLTITMLDLPNLHRLRMTDWKCSYRFAPVNKQDFGRNIIRHKESPSVGLGKFGLR